MACIGCAVIAFAGLKQAFDQVRYRLDIGWISVGGLIVQRIAPTLAHITEQANHTRVRAAMLWPWEEESQTHGVSLGLA